MTNQEQIDYILSEFDFLRVKNIMSFLNWKWIFQDAQKVPNEYELKNMSQGLLEQVSSFGNDDLYEMGSGGLWVQNRYGVLSLNFHLESADCHGLVEQKG